MRQNIRVRVTGGGLELTESEQAACLSCVNYVLSGNLNSYTLIFQTSQ